MCEKCAVLHLGLSNPGFEYMNHNSIVPSVSRAKDIGVIVSSDMKFSDHCNEIAGKAFKMSNMFFKSRNKEFTTSFFKTYIRSLENSTSVWNPYLLKDINLLESVQRKFTKRIPGLRNLSYEARLNCRWTVANIVSLVGLYNHGIHCRKMPLIRLTCGFLKIVSKVAIFRVF